MEERTPEEAIEYLKQFETLSELREAIGEISPEEQAFIDSIDIDSPLTDEERESLGPDFVERLIARTREEIRREDQPQS